MIMGLECLSYEEWLRAGGEKPQGDIINVSKDLKLERVKMKRDSSQLHSAKEQEAIGTKWFRGYFFNKRRKVFFFTLVAIREMFRDIVESSSIEIFKMQVEPTQGNLL